MWVRDHRLWGKKFFLFMLCWISLCVYDFFCDTEIWVFTKDSDISTFKEQGLNKRVINYLNLSFVNYLNLSFVYRQTEYYILHKC